MKFPSLLLFLCFLPSILHADTKTITEADVATPIVIQKGDTIVFSLALAEQSIWSTAIMLTKVLLPSGTNIPAGTPMPTQPLVEESRSTFNSLNQGSSIEIHYCAVALGQEVVLFTAAGLDPVYQYERTYCFVINVQDEEVQSLPST
ncbi:MAG: hypothetical protein FJ390_04045 [Verrucomicrobia bacterium]|nr:hypothetical protein [Verrucomicrobiota bacterium]